MPTYSNSATATPNPVNPGATQAMWPDWLINPLSGEYGALYGHPTTIHLKRDIAFDIIQNFPAQFTALRLFYSKAPEYHSAEYTWTIQDWPRPILEVSVGAAGATYPTTMSITLTAGGASYVVANDQVFFPDDTAGLVKTVNTATNVITIQPLINATIPALSAGDKLNPGGQIYPDGVNWIGKFDRMVTRSFTNYVTEFIRAARWTDRTASEYQRNNQTNFFVRDAEMKRMLVEQDAYQQFWNGTKGAFAIVPPADAALTTGTYEAKSSWGINKFLVANGAKHATSTPATLIADFKNLCMTTNYKAVNDPRYLFASEKVIDAFNVVMKDPIKYTPADKKYDVGLDMYQISPTIKIIPVICPLHEARSNMFPTSWENKYFCLDVNTITPVCEYDNEPFMHGNTGNQHISQGGYNRFIDYWVKANVSMKMTTTDGNFYGDIIGI